MKPESSFYTRRGDDGTTGLLGPERVPKHDIRPEAYGTVDEAQASLGVVRAGGCTPVTAEILLKIQRDLYSMMSELAAAGNASSPLAESIAPAHVAQLETWIARMEEKVQMPRQFVVPGDSRAGAALHLARTIARRAERLVVRMTHDGLLDNQQVLRYLNRLSTLLFVLAVHEDQVANAGTLTLAKGGPGAACG